MNVLGALAAVLVIGWAACQPSSSAPTPELPYPSYQADDPAPGDPLKTPGMSDREWCLLTAQHWQDAGAVVPDDWQCQGQPMNTWGWHPRP
jgi:hypothetical protein